MLVPERGYLLLLASLPLVASAQQLVGVKIEPGQANVGQPVTVIVEVGARGQREFSCGLTVSLGDGNTREIRVSEREVPLRIPHSYAAAGNYSVSAAGKIMIRGIRSVLPCEGPVRSAAVLVQGGAAAEKAAPAKLAESPKAAVQPSPPVAEAAPRPAAAAPAPAPAAPGGAAASAAPPAAAAPPAPRELPPFAGFKLDALAEQAKSSDPRIPWGQGGGASTPLAPEKASEHHGALRHAMTRMQAIHGSMTPQQKKDFSGVWAPFFDYPTSESHSYLKQLNPALDEYVSASAQAEAVAPVYRDSLAQLALTAAAGDDRATAMALDNAAAQVLLLKESQQRMDKALAQIKRIGNPPNPLAAKAAAQQLHQAVIGKSAGQGTAARARGSVARAGKQSGAIKIEIVEGPLRGGSPIKVRAVVPAAISARAKSYRWDGLDYIRIGESLETNTPEIILLTPVNEQPDFYIRIRAADAGGSVIGEGRLDGIPNIPMRFEFPPRVAGANDGGTWGTNEAGFGIWEKSPQPYIRVGSGGSFRFDASVSFSFDSDPSYWKEMIRRNKEGFERYRGNKEQLYRMRPMSLEGWSGDIVETLREDKGFYALKGDGYLTRRDTTHQIHALRVEYAVGITFGNCGWELEAACTSMVGSKTKELVQRVNSVLESAKWVPKGTAHTVVDQEQAAVPGDPAARKEAIEHHEALALQRDDSARRWEAQANSEKDPKRRQELLDNAEYDRDMAQAERDLAESLKSGTIVHTRTQWEDRQQQKLIENIKTELAEFDKDKHRLELLPKLGKLVQGADGVRLREELQKQTEQAIKAPDRGAQLDKMIERLKRVAVAQRDAEAAKKEDRLAQTEYYLETAEGIKRGADAAMFAMSFLVPGSGAISMAYGVGTGYAEGGITQAAENFARAQSNYIDVAAAALHGGLEIDPNTGRRRGLGAAVTTGLHTAVVNHLMGWATSKSTNFVQGVVNKAKLPARPEAFKDNHERYREAIAQAKTPEQRQAVEKNYRVIRDREMLKAELKQVTDRHEALARKVAGRPDGTIDTRNPEYQRIQSQWQSDMAAARAKYAGRETRMADHAKVFKAANLSPDDIPLSGGEPKHIMSDLDVAPKTLAAGQAYVNAVKSGGREVLDFHDRWIVPDSDMTIWKPGSGADKPGSRSFEESVVEASLFGSDKFPTIGGVEYTTQGGVTYDPRGAVMANAKKAVEAGIGRNESDLHVIGKSLDKAVEIAGLKADPVLMGKAKAARGHATAEECCVTFGASEQVKAGERAKLLAQSRATLADAYQAASETSNKFTASLNKQLAAAQARGDTATVNEINQTLNAYRLSNDLTINTLSVLDPATMGQIVVREAAPSPPSVQGFGWLTEQMARNRGADERARPPIAPAPALPVLSRRMKQAAVQVAERAKAVPAGSEEARYLGTLQKALERGVANPAQAVTEVRLVSGEELATVLNQLGADGGKR